MIEDSAFGRRRSDRIAGASAVIEQTIEQATIAARSQKPVWIYGPEGSGREHLARAIHAWSPRAGEAIETFSTSSVPAVLLSREIFGCQPDSEPLLEGGHEGAVQRAGKGTLLFTDADTIAAPVLSALVQAVKTGSFRRDGDGASNALRARLIFTARNADVSALGDLPVQVVRVAPLGERAEDILPLAVHFLALFAEEEGVEPVGFTPEARRSLVDEPWPGNVRELRERIRQAVRLCGDGAISVEALALSVDGEDVPSFKEAKRTFETRYVKGLLRRCGGNISRAARLAKKDRKDFYDVIRRTGVDPQEFRS